MYSKLSKSSSDTDLQKLSWGTNNNPPVSPPSNAGQCQRNLHHIVPEEYPEFTWTGGFSDLEIEAAMIEYMEQRDSNDIPESDPVYNDSGDFTEIESLTEETVSALDIRPPLRFSIRQLGSTAGNSELTTGPVDIDTESPPEDGDEVLAPPDPWEFPTNPADLPVLDDESIDPSLSEYDASNRSLRQGRPWRFHLRDVQNNLPRHLVFPFLIYLDYGYRGTPLPDNAETLIPRLYRQAWTFGRLERPWSEDDIQ
ncbi:hypothetical protein ABW19_dt0207315 [Dactylella cylindrospora]|nr:hypothetical protein ABW19_dt0207315 [Dactylella cylindrospora]